jgi:hypothetical protein
MKTFKEWCADKSAISETTMDEADTQIQQDLLKQIGFVMQMGELQPQYKNFLNKVKNIVEKQWNSSSPFIKMELHELRHALHDALRRNDPSMLDGYLNRF